MACFAALAALSAAIFSPTPPAVGNAWIWGFLWTAAALSTLWSLLLIATFGFSLRSLLADLAVPIALAFVGTPIAVGAGMATVQLWDDLGILTLHAVYLSLEAIGASVLYDPAAYVVGTPDFTVEVTSQCSGYEGIGLVLVFLGAYLVGFRERFRFPHVLILLPIAVLAAWALNVVRIVALILIGSAGFVSLAAGGFHSKAGWLFSCALALGSVAISQHLPWFSSREQPRLGRSYNPSAPYLVPLLAVLTTGLLTGLFEADFDYLYPVRAVVGLTVLWAFRRSYVAQTRSDLRGRHLLSPYPVGVGLVVYLAWTFMSGSSGNETAEGPPLAFLEMAQLPTAVWVVGRLAGSILIVPIVEELAFRGFLLRRLISPNFTEVSYETWRWGPVLVSSVVFAVAHQEIAAGFIAGLLYAHAQWKRGLLFDAVVAHSVTNALLSVEVLSRGSWALW